MEFGKSRKQKKSEDAAKSPGQNGLHKVWLASLDASLLQLVA